MTPLQKIIARLEATKNQSDFEISSNLLAWAKDLRYEERQMCSDYYTAGFMYSRRAGMVKSLLRVRITKTYFKI